MRLFHFVNKQFGLEDIEKRRLKIAQFCDLNDPFELDSIELSNQVFRKALKATKASISNQVGLLCFSRRWSNPVQWSHYADKHRGLRLGFEVADEFVAPIRYAPKRLVGAAWLAAEAERLEATDLFDDARVLRFFTTKFAHWRYEREMRIFLALRQNDSETDLYFKDFSQQLKLVQVIAGVRSEISRQQIAAALGSAAKDVQVFKARLAFKSFKVVRNRNESLWK